MVLEFLSTSDMGSAVGIEELGVCIFMRFWMKGRWLRLCEFEAERKGKELTHRRDAGGGRA